VTRTGQWRNCVVDLMTTNHMDYVQKITKQELTILKIKMAARQQASEGISSHY